MKEAAVPPRPFLFLPRNPVLTCFRNVASPDVSIQQRTEHCRVLPKDQQFLLDRFQLVTAFSTFKRLIIADSAPDAPQGV